MPQRQTLLDNLMSMQPAEIQSFISETNTTMIETLMDQIKALKRQWLDENCKLSLSQLANNDLKIENSQLQDQILGLAKELHLANVTIINLKRSLLQTSNTAKQGVNILNPLTPILRTIGGNKATNTNINTNNTNTPRAGGNSDENNKNNPTDSSLNDDIKYASS